MGVQSPSTLPTVNTDISRLGLPRGITICPEYA